jgi:hypothetical protein
MTKFKFVDDLPPATLNNRRSDPLVKEFAETLRGNPGRWSEYPHTFSSNPGASSFAYRVNNGYGPVPLRGGFEAVARQGVVFVRFAT